MWIEGVEGFNPGEYASSVHGSQARILETLGESLSYDDLICYGGFAFRRGVHEAFCHDEATGFAGDAEAAEAMAPQGPQGRSTSQRRPTYRPFRSR